MRIFVLVLLMFCGAGIAFAQNYTTKKTADKKVLKLWERVEHYSAAEQFDEALDELEKIFKVDSAFIDGHTRWAGIKYTQDKFAEAIPAYRNALALSESYDPDIFYQLALTYYNQDKFAEAIPWFERFLQSDTHNERLKNRAGKYLDNCRFAAEAIKNPVPFEPKKMGTAINTSNAEYFPSLTADGEALVYTTRIYNQEDLYMSHKKNGEWQKGEPLEGVNTEQNEGTQQISADGKFLVFTACERKGGMGSCDIYFSEKRNGAWSKPANIGPPVNTSAWESQPSISANGKTLYFASKREGGYGGSDIWVSYRQPNGRWSRPENLGDSINTPEDDQSPFIHPDGKTLYFMSKGHPGFGESDLFVARLEDDNNWSKPRNFGFPINTRAEESALIVSLDGATAYFSMVERDQTTISAFPTRADVNIYTFELPQSLRPDPVTYVKARVFEDGTKLPLVANVEFTDLRTGAVYASAQTDADGEFLVCLPLGKDYALNVNKEKYLFHSENFNLTEITSLTEPFVLEIGLVPVPENLADATPLEKSKPIVLRNVFFETGSAALRPESKIELNRLKSLLDENSKLKIRINGHTDNVGSEEANQKLSEQRAKAVHDYLVQNGIDAKRLSYKGFGESQPIDTNDTPEGRQRNRRTEFEVM